MQLISMPSDSVSRFNYLQNDVSFEHKSTSEPMEFMFLPRGPTAAAPASHLDMVDNTVSSIWQVKKEKEEANNGWGLPPANPYSQV